MPLATSNFLVPNGTFIVVLIAFIIVLYVITKYVLPPLNAALTERQEQIRGELEAADKAKADAEEADVERRAVLEQARVQAREIVSQAQTTADQIVTSATAEGQAIHDRIVTSADAEVVVARQAAVEEVTARVGEIVLAAAERVIGREIRTSDHQDLINEAIAALVTRRTLGDDRQVLHVSGERDFAYMQAEERDVGANHVKLVPYLPDPANAYAAADVAIARAGASTLAELATTATPAILIPYPFAADDHQASNAAVFVERGAAVAIADAELDGDRLWWALDAILTPDRLAAMRAAAASLAVPDAGRAIVRRIEVLIPARVVEASEANGGARD